MTVSVRATRLDTFASQATFRVLLDALTRPGSVRRLPDPTLGAAAVALALADVETTVAVTGEGVTTDSIVLATGAAPVVVEHADLVACTGPTTAAEVRRLRRGSALEPEKGARVGVECRRLTPAGRGEVTLRLSGPGVRGEAAFGVDGLDLEFFIALRTANAEPPAGIDVWLVDAEGSVAGLPRSCRLEVH